MPSNCHRVYVPSLVLTAEASFLLKCRHTGRQTQSYRCHWYPIPCIGYHQHGMMHRCWLYTPWVKKRRHYTLVHIFAKYWPIFIIFSPTTQFEICNKIINEDHTSPQMCCYTTLWNVNVRTRATFCQSFMVSVGVSKLGWTHLIFVDLGVKINGCYYREVLLSQQLLPAIWQVSGDFFV